jgi:purine-binding chemotaxis protein CheW
MSAFTFSESSAVRQAAASADFECLCFRLGSEEYGIDILCVQEIRGFEKPTRIAGAAPCVLGVLDLRGLIVPVVDLRQRFGLVAEFDALTVTVILNVKGRTIGAVVDRVSNVMDLVAGQVKPAAGLGAALDSAHVRAIATLEHDGRARLLQLLDIEALVGAADLGLSALNPQESA